MVADRLLRAFEPSEDAAVALVENALRRADAQAGNDLFDELALLISRKRSGDFGIVQDARCDDGLVAASTVAAQRVEVWKARDVVDHRPLPPPVPCERT